MTDSKAWSRGAKTMICTRCGREKAEWHFNEEHYCQLCWEAHCSEEWWALGVWQNGKYIVEELKL